MVLPSRNSFHGDGGDRLGVQVQGSKRKFTFKSAVKDVMKEHSLSEIVLLMEPFFRKVVREEVDRLIHTFCNSSPRPLLNPIKQTRGGGLCLQFVGKLSSTIFTGSRIEAEDGTQVKLVLLDSDMKVVRSGPLSSVKVEIVALDGDFCANEQEDWSVNEFNAKLLREREGRRPLVTGELSFTLKDGVVTLNDVVFTDNSSWIRSRKFRLGARIVQRVSGEVTIREAVSEAFIVKDHRGELYKKHYPPSPSDEVWRLERIAKDGAFHNRLASNKVCTVKDFLRLNSTDPSALRSVLGSGISNRVLEAIIDHASTCVLDDDELYAYYGVAQRAEIVMNSIYKVVRATFDGQNYLPLEKLTFHQKILVEDVKRQAYKNTHEFVLIDRLTVMGPSRPLTCLPSEPFNSPNLGLQQLGFSPALAGQPEMQLCFSQSSNSSSYTYEHEVTHQPQMFNPTMRNSFSMRDLFPIPNNAESGWSQGFPPTSIVLPDTQTPNWSQVNTAWDLGNGFDNDSQYSMPVPTVKSRVAWGVIRSAFKLMSFRKDLAAKRMARAPSSYISYY